MNRKKSLALLVVLALLLSMIPAAVLAEAAAISASISIEGPRVEATRARTGSATPTLSSGYHQYYLDRVASMPDYAKEFYQWLEDNSGADGILVDPTKGEEDNGEYYHTVHFASGSEKFTFSSKEEILETGKAIASAGLEKSFSSFSNWVNVVLDVFDRDHPEVFWLSGQSSLSYLGSWSYSTRGSTCTVHYEADLVIWLQYPGFDIRSTSYKTAAAVVNDMKVRDAKVQEILAGCPDGDDYDRVAYLNDVLTARNAYNSAVASGKSSKADASAWECISALVGRSGASGPVCEGYSRAFQILCTELNIPCVLVDGEAVSFRGEEPESHMWNYVQIDGGWYAVDVTWNDPYVASAPDKIVSGHECRDWLLLGSDSEVAPGLTFLESHKETNCIRPGGLAYTNGPVLEREAYSPNTVTLYSIGGAVVSGTAGDVTVELLCNGVSVGTQTYSGKTASYLFENVEPGTYELKISKKNHVTRKYTATVADAAVTVDTKIHLLGDIDGNGKVNTGDVAKLNAHLKGATLLTDPYVLECANVNGGKLNMGDVGLLYAHSKGAQLLH